MNYECDLCGGTSFVDLGRLGNLRHLRCRNCGANCCYELVEEVPMTIFTSRHIDPEKEGLDNPFDSE